MRCRAPNNIVCLENVVGVDNNVCQLELDIFKSRQGSDDARCPLAARNEPESERQVFLQLYHDIPNCQSLTAATEGIQIKHGHTQRQTIKIAEPERVPQRAKGHVSRVSLSIHAKSHT